MELSSALSVPAPSAVETAATCVHLDIHIPIVTKNRRSLSNLLDWGSVVFRRLCP